MDEQLEYIRLQYHYDSRDFTKGKLVTCVRLLPYDRDIHVPHPANRRVDFYGIITDEGVGGWCNVVYEETGGKKHFATFHREELVIGFQPSWHQPEKINTLHNWLEGK